MSREPWQSDQERRLFVRAVARFSDDCMAPDLTPECPFYVESTQGPVCAEECRDLIARHPEDLVQPDRMVLGAGIEAVRRPRPRRGPDKNAKAFDAREMRLSETGSPGQWRTPSLLVELKNQFMFPSFVGDDGLQPEELIAEAQHRGIHVDQLIRLGLSHYRVAAVLVQVAVEHAGKEPRSPWTELVESYVDATRSQSAITVEHSDPGRLNVLFASGFPTALLAWLQRAELSDLTVGRVPSVEELIATEAPIEGESAEEQVWLLDRLTETYLDEWQPSSLMSEWRYLHSLRRACAPTAVMRERQVSATELSALLADRACLDWEHKHEYANEPTRDALPVSTFTSAALRNLQIGRRSAAVTIFRGLVELRPDSAEAWNNLGFCLIPDEPAEAVATLQECISKAGQDATALNYLNFALACHRIGEDDRALHALKCASANEPANSGAMMWRIDDPVRVERVDDLTVYARTLEDHLARCQGGCGPVLP